MADTHDGNAGTLVASQNRPLDGGGAAPTRQQRRMHVHDTERCHVQNLIGQDAAVGGNAEDVGLGLM